MRYLPILLLGALLLSTSAGAHTEGDHRGNPSAAGAAGEAVEGPGIEERLGKKIPLDLNFRDEAGRPVPLSGLVTGPTLIIPVYYGCTNVCSYLQSGAANALRAVRRTAGTDYRVISVSFDETETPAMAARAKRMYLASMGRPFPEDGWRFLTGDVVSIRRLTDAAGYRFQRRGHDFIHPVASFVVAGDGTIVRYLYGINFLPKDLTLAFVEAQEGVVGKSVRTMVGFCFSFDPAGKTYVFNVLRVSATVVVLTAGSFLAFLVLTGKKGKGKRIP